MSAPRISLICATVGRREELSRFLLSLRSQSFRDYEVLIIDQNPEGWLSEVLAEYSDLPLRRVPSACGLSRARNVGICEARGEILAFPDDDSWFYPDTLQQAVAILDSHRDLNFVLGRIHDRERNRDVLRKFPATECAITRLNFYRRTTSITLFVRKDCGFFDEGLGAGAQFGSCEDVDFVYELLKSGKQGRYLPQIEVMHPDQALVEFTEAKAYSYGSGFGAFCRKNLDCTKAVLFTGGLGNSVAAVVLDCVRFGLGKAAVRISSVRGRLRGFCGR